MLVIRTQADLSSPAFYLTHNGNDQPLAMANTSLIAINANGDTLPRLANSWDISADLKTYTFHLNKWVWSDGKPVVAGDVKFSVEQVLRPYNPFGSNFSVVDSIDTPDSETVVFHFKEPQGDFMRNLTEQEGAIVPQHAFAGCSDIPKCPVNDHPITAGPYMFGKWVRGSYVSLVPNPYWVGAKPYFDEIRWKIVPDTNTALLELKKGNIDLLPQYPGAACRDVVAAQQDPNLQAVKVPSLTGDTAGLLMNGYTPPLNNKTVRLAVATAIDREAIVKSIYCGLATVPTAFVSDQGPLRKYSPSATGQPPSGSFFTPSGYDPEKAKRMLDSAGYPAGPDGTRFTLKFTAIGSEPPQPEVADAIAGYLKAVGIKVTVDIADEATHWGRIYSNDPHNPWKGYNLGLVSAGWNFPQFLKNWFSSSRLWNRNPGVMFDNAWNFNSPKFDAAIDRALQSTGSDQVAAVTEAQGALAEEMPNFPLATLALTEIANKCVQGLPTGYGLYMLSPYPQGNSGKPYDLGWKPGC